MRRASSLVLFLVLASSHTVAAVADIPSKYLDQEARLRAAMTPNARAHVASLTGRLTTKMSVTDVKVMTGGESAASIFLVMIDYLKMMQKDAREDRKMSHASADMALAAKDAKIQLDNSKIADQKAEAEKRFDAAMQAANLEILLGIVSGAPRVVATIPTETPTPTLKPVEVRVR